MELVVPEDMSVLGVKAKHNANAKDIEPAQGFIGAVTILFKQCVINTANDFTSLHGDAHLLGDMLTIGIYEKLQAVILFPQVFQQDAFRLTVWELHVVNQKLGEVASDNPARMLG